MDTQTALEAGGHEEVAVEPADADTDDERIEALEAALEEANAKALRILADFQNYKRRALVDERRAREDGAASVLGGVVTVLDHFDLALNVDPEKTSAASVIEGVRLIKQELLKTLADQGVEPIRPEPGDEFDPNRHQATGQFPAEGVQPGAVTIIQQQGYALGDRVLRPATVLIAPERSGDDEPPERLDTEG